MRLPKFHQFLKFIPLWAILLLLLPCVIHGQRPEPAYPAEKSTALPQYSQFPRPLSAYETAAPAGASPAQKPPVWEIIKQRAQKDPFNVAASVIFILAILHTFFAGFFHSWSVRVEKQHHEKMRLARNLNDPNDGEPAREKVSFKAVMLEFLGEVEAIFSIWVIPLLVVALFYHSWGDVKSFMAYDSVFTEPMFVVIIMAISATRPVISFAEACLSRVAGFGGGTPAAWWFTLVSVAPILGSLITEPAAMTIAALLLGKKFFVHHPSNALKYATLGLLFVNISIGGVLTNFAAPPVLMVAGPDRWNWSSMYMLQHFGWKAVVALVVSATLYFAVFRKELTRLNGTAKGRNFEEPRAGSLPMFVVGVHLLIMAWTVFTAHYPVLFVGGFLFFLAFLQATHHHQDNLSLRGPLLVGFFLAGLVIHGRLQAWWLEPILNSGLGDWGLHLGAAGLTAFNDNALITFLAAQVPGLSESAKYVILAGAVAGGGLTVIANAPNPAGQSLLKRYFDNGVSPLWLFLGALVPTIIAICCFMLLPR